MDPELNPHTPARRWRRRLLWAGLVLLAYVVILGGVVPRIARGLAEKRLAALTGGPVRIGSLHFHPLALRLQVRDLSLAEPDGTVFLAWSNVLVDLQASSLWRREVVLRRFAVEAPVLRIRRDSQGGIPLVELGRRLSPTNAPAPAPSGATSLFPLFVAEAVLTNGLITFEDAAVPGGFRARLESLNFGVSQLSTRSGATSAWSYAVGGDQGERLAGTGTLRVEPLLVEGVLRGASIPLTRSQPYLAGLSPMHPTHGWLAFTLPFQGTFAPEGPDLQVTEGRVALTNIAVVEAASGEPFAEVGGVGLEGIDVALGRREATLGVLRLAGAVLHVRRLPATNAAPPRTNLRGLVAPEVVETLVRDLTEWRLALGSLVLEASQVGLEDRTFDPPTRLALNRIEVRANGLSNASNAPPVAVEGSLGWNEQGDVRWKAGGTLLPAAAEASLNIEDLDLRPLGPYLSQVIDLTLGQGTFSADLQARYGRATGDSGLASLGGQLAVQRLAAVESGSGSDFLRWETVALNDLRASMEPNRLGLGELHVQKLQTSLVLLTNGQFNVLDLIRRAREAGVAAMETPAAPAAPSDPTPKDVAEAAGTAPAREAAPFWETWPIRVDRVRLEEVGIFAADQYIGGDFRTSVESLDGEIRGLALPAETPAEIDLKARLTAVSGFELSGTLNPDPRSFAADLKLSAHRADLVQFAPYTLRFASYPVTRGELTAEVHYRVRGSSLEASNRVVLDQFTLGPKTPHPDALDLPLKLGVALLKDTEGKIQLDVPLTGSLDDPQFRVAPILWQAIRNILVKAATAPFRLLGSLLGGDGGEDDLEFVEFDPGATNLLSGQDQRILRLARALQQRPELQVAIVPGFHPGADKRALATARLDRRLRSLRLEEIGASGVPLPAADRVEVPAADRPRLIALAYQRDFGSPPAEAASPTLPSFATNAPPATAAPTAEAPPAGGPPAQALEERLLELIDIPPENLQELARRRAEVVAAVLTGSGLAPERITVAPEAADVQGDARPRVSFRLE